MPAAEFVRLEKRIDEVSTEGVNINVTKGTSLYREIRLLLKKRHKISELKCMALL